jgi:hypothetical protein
LYGKEMGKGRMRATSACHNSLPVLEHHIAHRKENISQTPVRSLRIQHLPPQGTTAKLKSTIKNSCSPATSCPPWPSCRRVGGGDQHWRLKWPWSCITFPCCKMCWNSPQPALLTPPPKHTHTHTHTHWRCS